MGNPDFNGAVRDAVAEQADVNATWVGVQLSVGSEDEVKALCSITIPAGSSFEKAKIDRLFQDSDAQSFSKILEKNLQSGSFNIQVIVTELATPMPPLSPPAQEPQEEPQQWLVEGNVKFAIFSGGDPLLLVVNPDFNGAVCDAVAEQADVNATWVGVQLSVGSEDEVKASYSITIPAGSSFEKAKIDRLFQDSDAQSFSKILEKNLQSGSFNIHVIVTELATPMPPLSPP